MASHELKTPLTTLKLHLQRLQGKLETDETPALQSLMRQVSRLNRLVNQMLDVAELTSGALTLDMQALGLGRSPRRWRAIASARLRHTR